MSYLDGEEFREKSARFSRRAQLRREAFGRALLDAESAEIADEMAPAQFVRKLCDQSKTA